MFEFRGKQYKSFAECCRQYDIPVNGGIRRYAQYHNITKQQALEVFMNKPRYTHGVTYEGKFYKSIIECCKDLGITHASVYSYKQQNNVSSEEAIYAVYERKQEKCFLFKNKKYKNFIECCKAFSANKDYIMKISKKIQMAPIEVLDFYITNGKYPGSVNFCFKGKKYTSLKDCCNELGVNINTVQNMSYKYGMSKQEILDFYVTNGYYPSSQNFYFRGKLYKTFKHCCDDYDLGTWVRTKIRIYSENNEVSLQYALERYLLDEMTDKPRTSAKPYKFTFRNKEYNSLEEFCKEFKISVSSIYNITSRYRISREEVIEFYLTNGCYPNNRNFCFRGKMYKSFMNCCNCYNIDDTTRENITFHSRYHKISKQELMERYLAGELKFSTRGFTFRNKTYSSFMACCREFNVDRREYIYEIARDNNISKQEALEKYLEDRSKRTSKLKEQADIN